MFFWLSTAFLLLTIAFATGLGASPERWGGLTLLAMTIITFSAYAIFPRIFGKVDPTALTVDLVGFVGIAAIALFSKRIWPLWAISFQILSVAAHLIRAFDIRAAHLTYSIMKTGPSYMIMLCLIVGTINHLRKGGQNDRGPYWRNWSAAHRTTRKAPRNNF